jgi:hypothetical protein
MIIKIQEMTNDTLFYSYEYEWSPYVWAEIKKEKIRRMKIAIINLLFK